MSRSIRTLTPSGIATLISWAGAEGWNPGLGDAEAFAVADPAGFIGAFDGDDLVAAISAVRYGIDFGFIGLYICRPDRRGEGHGRAVWDAGIAHLSGRTIGLDGVPAQQDSYRRMGFAIAYQSVRMSGDWPVALDGDVVPVSEALLPQVMALDRRCFSARREAFLDTWLEPPRRALALVKFGRVVGYGAARPCLLGSKIGPLFAETATDARTLLGALADGMPGPLQLDVPVSQPGFVHDLSRAGFTAGFSTARMYRGPAPEQDVRKVFAVTTLELG